MPILGYQNQASKTYSFVYFRPSDSPYGLPVVVDRPPVPVRLRAAAANVDAADEDDEPQVHLPFAPAPTPQAVPRLNDLADLYVLEFGKHTFAL